MHKLTPEAMARTARHGEARRWRHGDRRRPADADRNEVAGADLSGSGPITCAGRSSTARPKRPAYNITHASWFHDVPSCHLGTPDYSSMST